MFSIFKKNYRLLQKFKSIALKVNSLEESFVKLNDSELKNKTLEFKNRLKNGEKLDSLLPEAFATVREASKRVLGKRHFDVQIIGGIALHKCMVAEMLTGEGKTLVSTLASYLNSLEGKGVHVVTVNDYLAKRDAEWMGSIFSFLGLTTSCVLSGLNEEERKVAYAADITYGTNNEFGFDYLRDNMKLSLKDLAQRPFNFAIIDEVDSVLIDEARTPLIISGQDQDNTKIYQLINTIAQKFQPIDFEIDEKQKSIHIHDEGLIKFENALKTTGIKIKGSLFDSQNLSLYHLINQALRAHYLYKKDVDYIIKDDNIIIIDEFTGRMMEGRRFSEGLHQALEAKEGVKIQNENQTLASITLQNYFKMYPKLAGMTGTALTEAKELLEIYGLHVLAIPPNKPVTRKDFNDLIYRNTKDKESAIVEKVSEYYKNKQPVLIGTVSIEKSERLSTALTKAKIPHNVLNAKNHEREAYIIAEAGRLGAVTIATNMAGRGTDIQLGGNLEMMIKQQTENLTDETQKEAIVKKITENVTKQKEQAIALGGLAVIGTERHESRRIDNQLRGRSGRQGEPGSSVFYLSLEDDLMRIFGGDKLQNTLKRLGFKEGESITHSFISRAIEKAQKKVEEYNFQIRKSLLRFDTIINEQRNLIYEQRRDMMDGNIDVNNTLLMYTDEIMDDITNTYFSEKEFREHWDFDAIHSQISRLFNSNLDIKNLALEQNLDRLELAKRIKQQFQDTLKSKEDLIGEEVFKDTIKSIMLQNIDFAWRKHLSELDYVRSAINLRAYGQKDPFNEYQIEAFNLFQVMLQSIKEDLVTIVSHIQIQTNEDAVGTNPAIADSRDGDKLQEVAPSISKPKDVFFNDTNRNDLCYCGSGKKYKHCHGKL